MSPKVARPYTPFERSMWEVARIGQGEALSAPTGLTREEREVWASAEQAQQEAFGALTLEERRLLDSYAEVEQQEAAHGARQTDFMHALGGVGATMGTPGPSSRALAARPPGKSAADIEWEAHGVSPPGAFPASERLAEMTPEEVEQLPAVEKRLFRERLEQERDDRAAGKRRASRWYEATAEAQALSPLVRQYMSPEQRADLSRRVKEEAVERQARADLRLKANTALENVPNRRKTLEIIRSVPEKQRELFLEEMEQGASEMATEEDQEWVGMRVARSFVRSPSDIAQPIMEMIGAGGTKEEIQLAGQIAGIEAEHLSDTHSDDPLAARWITDAARMLLPSVMIAAGGGAAGGAAKAAGWAARGQKLATAGGVTGMGFPGAYRESDAEMAADGVNPWIRKPTAVLTGMAVAAAEAIIPDPFPSKGLSKATFRQGVRKIATETTQELLRKYPGELSEEVIQGALSETGRVVASWMDTTVPDQDLGNAFLKAWDQGKQAAGPLLIMMGGPAVSVGTARAVQDATLPKITPAMREEAMEIAGYQQVAAAPPPPGLVQQIWDRMDPDDRTAGWGLKWQPGSSSAGGPSRREGQALGIPKEHMRSVPARAEWFWKNREDLLAQEERKQAEFLLQQTAELREQEAAEEEARYAEQERKASQDDASRRAQPGVRGEAEDTAEGGPRVREGGPEGREVREGEIEVPLSEEGEERISGHPDDFRTRRQPGGDLADMSHDEAYAIHHDEQVRAVEDQKRLGKESPNGTKAWSPDRSRYWEKENGLWIPRSGTTGEVAGGEIENYPGGLEILAGWTVERPTAKAAPEIKPPPPPKRPAAKPAPPEPAPPRVDAEDEFRGRKITQTSRAEFEAEAEKAGVPHVGSRKKIAGDLKEAEANVAENAEGHGLRPASLLNAARVAYKEEQEKQDAHTDAKRAFHEATGLTPEEVSWVENNNVDYTNGAQIEARGRRLLQSMKKKDRKEGQWLVDLAGKLKGLDSTATSIVQEHEGTELETRDVEGIWELLKEAEPEPLRIDSPKVLESARAKIQGESEHQLVEQKPGAPEEEVNQAAAEAALADEENQNDLEAALEMIRGREGKAEPPKQGWKKRLKGTVEEKAKESQDELGSALKEFGKTLRGKTYSNPWMDPELVRLAAKVTIKAAKAGVYSFADLMLKVTEQFGEDATKFAEPVFRETWEAFRKKHNHPYMEVMEATEKAEEVTPEDEAAAADDTPYDFRTSIRNAKVDILREGRGAAPLEVGERISDAEVFDEAEDRIKKHDALAIDMVERYEERPWTMDEYEVGVLQLAYRALHNKIDANARAKAAAIEAGNESQGVDVQSQIDADMKLLGRMEEVTRAVGSSHGRALRLRQMEILEDFSYERMLTRAKANKGSPLTEEERVKVIAMATEIAELQRLVAQRAVDHQIDLEINRARGPARRATTTERKAAAKEKAAAAWERLKAAQAAWASEPDDVVRRGMAIPVPSRDMVSAGLDMVRAYAELGVATFEELMRNLVADFGEEIRKSEAALRASWDQVVGEGDVDVPDFNAMEPESIGRLARKIVRSVVETTLGDRGDPEAYREQVVDAVHAELAPLLQDAWPDWDRRQTMDAISGYGRFRELSKDEVSKEVRRINGELQQLAKLEDMAQGIAPKKTGVARRDVGDTESDLIRKVNEAKRRGGYIVTDPEKQLKSALSMAKDAVQRRIRQLKREIKTGERTVPQRTSLKADAELESLRDERDELQKDWDAIFRRHELTDEERARRISKTLDRLVVNLETDITEGRLWPEKKTKISTPQIEAKRARLEATRALRDRLREMENPNAVYKAGLTKRLADLQERIANRDFARKEVKQRKLDKEDVDMLYKIDQEKMKFREMQRAWDAKRRHPVIKGLSIIPQTFNISRAVITAFDLSAIFRQGGISTVSHPIMTAKAIPKQLAAFASERAEFAVMQEIQSRKNAQLYRLAKLPLVSTMGAMTKQEESFMGGLEYAKFLPSLKASARAHTTFLNQMRADLFDSLIAAYEVDGKIPTDQAKIFANFVGDITGRSGFGKLEAVGTTASTVLFAPRWVLSRFKMMTGMPLWMALAKGDMKTKKIVAKEYARQVAAMGLTYSAFMMAGAALYDDDDPDRPRFELNPVSPDFGKMRIGNTRIDLSAGLSQPMVFVARLLTGKTKKASGEVVPIRKWPVLGHTDRPEVPFGGTTASDVVWRFVRSKFSPIAGTTMNLLAGENVVGEEMTTGKFAGDLVVPMSLRDILEAMEDQGIPKGAALGMLSIVGMSLQSYETRKKSRATAAPRNPFKSSRKRGVYRVPPVSAPPLYSP